MLDEAHQCTVTIDSPYSFDLCTGHGLAIGDHSQRLHCCRGQFSGHGKAEECSNIARHFWSSHKLHLLAQALQAGISLPDYARTRRLSLNTVYTHLRRVREKTNCARLPKLIHKLNDWRAPLRMG